MTAFGLSDIELHNIAELDPDAGYPGALIRRYPRAVAESFDNGSLVSEDASLSELRFVPVTGRRLAISFTSPGGGDLFVYRGDFVQNHVRVPAGAAFRQILDFENDLSTIAAGFAGRRLHLFDGREILPAFSGLTCDFVHPSTEGHTVMAENLANHLRVLGIV